MRKITEGQREQQDNSMAAWAPVGGRTNSASVFGRSPLKLGLSCLRSLCKDLESHKDNTVIPGRSLDLVVPAPPLEGLEVEGSHTGGQLCLHALLLLLLLSRFSRVRLCATPQTEAHQTRPVPGILQARILEWLPFPSPMHESEK